MITPEQQRVQEKLKKLMMVTVQERYALLFAAGIQEQLTYKIDLNSSPYMCAMKIINELNGYGCDEFNKLAKFVDAQPLPDFIK